MNKKIKAVLDNREAKATDYFELINIFECSSLSVQRDGTLVISMDINQYDPIHDGHKFLQECTDTNYVIKGKDIESVSGRLLEDTKTFLISVFMNDGLEISVYIFNIDTNEKLEEYAGYFEVDATGFYEYLQKAENCKYLVVIDDVYGFKTRFGDATVVLQEMSDGHEYNLHITNGTGITIDLPLVNDSCNKIFAKERDTNDAFLVKPYGQPFMKIKIAVIKPQN